MDFLQLASATSLDAIGSAGLGTDFNALNTESDYKSSVKQLMFVDPFHHLAWYILIPTPSPTLTRAMAFVPLAPILRRICPASLRSWAMNMICPWLGSPGRSSLELRRILGIMEDTSLGVFLQKFSQVEEGQVGQADILSNLGKTYLWPTVTGHLMQMPLQYRLREWMPASNLLKKKLLRR